MEIAYKIVEIVGYALVLTFAIDVLTFGINGRHEGKATGFAMIDNMTKIASFLPLLIIDLVFKVILGIVTSVLKMVVGLISSKVADKIEIKGADFSGQILNKLFPAP